MKKILMTLSIAALTLSMVACNASANNTDTGGKQIKVIQDEISQTYDGNTSDPSTCMIAEMVDYRQVDRNDLPQGVLDQIKDQALEAGYDVIQTDSATYLVVYMGQRNSGGYFLEVDGIHKVGDEFMVTVQENEPGPDMMVTMAITYPWTVVLVEDETFNPDKVVIDRYNPTDLDPGEVIDPVDGFDEEANVMPIDHVKEGDSIMVGEVMDFKGNTIHILSGDLVMVYALDADLALNHYIGETVELIKKDGQATIQSYIIDDFSINYTSMGMPIVSVNGTILSIDGDQFIIQVGDEEISLSGAEGLNLVVGETLTIEYADFFDGEKYAGAAIRESEAYNLKVLSIERLDSGMMQIRATDDMDSGEVAYVVTVDLSTVIRLNLSELKVGDNFKAYADLVMESYPAQMTATRITK